MWKKKLYQFSCNNEKKKNIRLWISQVRKIRKGAIARLLVLHRELENEEVYIHVGSGMLINLHTSIFLTLSLFRTLPKVDIRRVAILENDTTDPQGYVRARGQEVYKASGNGGVRGGIKANAGVWCCSKGRWRTLCAPSTYSCIYILVYSSRYSLTYRSCLPRADRLYTYLFETSFFFLILFFFFLERKTFFSKRKNQSR